MVEDGKGPIVGPLNVGEDSDSLADERSFYRSMASFGKSTFLLMIAKMLSQRPVQCSWDKLTKLTDTIAQKDAHRLLVNQYTVKSEEQYINWQLNTGHLYKVSYWYLEPGLRFCPMSCQYGTIRRFVLAGHGEKTRYRLWGNFISFTVPSGAGESASKTKSCD